MSNRKDRQRQAEDQRRWYEEKADIAVAAEAAAKQHLPVDGLRPVTLPTLADGLEELDARGLRPSDIHTEVTIARSLEADVPSPGSPEDYKRHLSHVATLPPDLNGHDQVRPLFTDPGAYPKVDHSDPLERSRTVARWKSGGATHHVPHVEPQQEEDPHMDDDPHASVVTEPDQPAPVNAEVDWATERVNSALWLAEQRRLLSSGLRRCPRCRKVSVVEDFNTTGYCLCRKIGDNPYRPPSFANKNAGRKSVERPSTPEPTRYPGGQEQLKRDAAALVSRSEPSPTDALGAVLDVADAVLEEDADLDVRQALGLPPRSPDQREVDIREHLWPIRDAYFQLLCKFALDAQSKERREEHLERIERNLADWGTR